ncbi:putative ribonuclease H-like domain-containing protein [Tanacetum coccineum]|uniref:Ribonuclease H-like domain-containing protein n=1 Tax=Tanacetum coccineum TaxID=301880 RepID=A0ABQ5GLL3_9ASTR
MQVYVDDIIFGSTKKSLCVEFEQMMHKRFQMSSMGEVTFFLGLQVKQKDDGIFISQDKYVADILNKFDFVIMKIASTLIETNKALLKDEEAEDVDVHLYRSMIGSLMYLIAFRPDIMFAICACARFQVTPKVSHLHAVKRIFRYLKVANSTTEAEYVAAANCCRQKPGFHSKTKHIKMRHHFIIDSYEKRLIQVIKIHIDHNVAYLLTKAFDVSSIRDKFGNKSGSCKATHIEYMVLNVSPLKLLIQPVAPPSPNYIPDSEDPETPPVPHDEDELEEQPLPPIDSPTAESPGYVTELDPEEDPEEYEDEEIEDGPVDYPVDGGDDGDDDDGDSSRDDADDKDEDEEDEEEGEHPAPVDSVVVIPTVEHVSPPKGT